MNDLPTSGNLHDVGPTRARYRRLVGEKTRFLTGTDEHGQNIERAAAALGIEPIELADRVVRRYHELWKTFEIGNDDFIRTTEARHRRGVEEIIRRIEAAGDLYLDRHRGYWRLRGVYTEKELVAERPSTQARRWDRGERVSFPPGTPSRARALPSPPGFVPPRTAARR